MKEWIQHYINEGVCKFFLINNNSDDNFMEILESYIEAGIVELFHEPRNYVQVDSYNKYCLEKSKKYEFAIICDFDEFIYSRNGFNTITDYLITLDKSISQIYIPWKLFGSNAFIEQPKTVTKSFTKRTNYDKPPDLLMDVLCIIIKDTRLRKQFLDQVWL
jgi:hypothetical protein